MTRLSQILALRQDVEQHADAALAQAQAALRNSGPLSGISRTYSPFADGEEHELPSESTRVQVRVEDVLATLRGELTRFYDLSATIDWANREASADVIGPDGTVLIPNAPTTYLLWLEKQLRRLEALIKGLPTLDQAENWDPDKVNDLWATPPSVTMRTKKVPRNHELAPATREHKAQVHMYTEDVPEGRWTTVKFSGALPPARAAELLARVRNLLAAVKTAREEANAKTIEDQRVGDRLLGYLFG